MTARLLATVDFPSPGIALVTITVRKFRLIRHEDEGGAQAAEGFRKGVALILRGEERQSAADASDGDIWDLPKDWFREDVGDFRRGVDPIIGAIHQQEQAGPCDQAKEEAGEKMCNRAARNLLRIAGLLHDFDDAIRPGILAEKNALEVGKQLQIHRLRAGYRVHPLRIAVGLVSSVLGLDFPVLDVVIEGDEFRLDLPDLGLRLLLVLLLDVLNLALQKIDLIWIAMSFGCFGFQTLLLSASRARVRLNSSERCRY